MGVSLTEFEKAVKATIGHKVVLKDEEAKEIANHALSFFGYSERIVDNVLEVEDRDAFYMLEDVGLLTTEREETTATIYNPKKRAYEDKPWRTHYWVLRVERIKIYAKIGHEENNQLPNPYDNVPDEAYVRNGAKTEV